MVVRWGGGLCVWGDGWLCEGVGMEYRGGVGVIMGGWGRVGCMLILIPNFSLS